MPDTRPRVLLAFSGGLDTTYCAVWLREARGFEVHTALVDTGGFSESELAETERRARDLGVASHATLRETERYYRDLIRYLVYGNALRGGVYPLCVSAERIHQATAIARYAAELGVDAVAHGSTGAGNDQVRFDLVFQLLAPGTEIVTPIREQGLSREAEIAYLREHGVDLPWSQAQYSINRGLWGTSVGGAETLTSDGVLPEEAWPTQLTATEPRTVTLGFTRGELTAVDGEALAPVAAIRRLHALAAPYAVGRGVHVGDTIIGTKGRVGFEAPAPTLILDAHRLLEKHTLSKWQQHWKEQLGQWYGMFVHEAQYHEPVMRDLEAFLEHTQATVTGEVDVRLDPRRYELLGARSPHDLMDRRFGAYGEATGGWDGADVRGFTRILANPLRIARQVAASADAKTGVVGAAAKTDAS